MSRWYSHLGHSATPYKTEAKPQTSPYKSFSQIREQEELFKDLTPRREQNIEQEDDFLQTLD